MSAGRAHACLLADGKVRCWGNLLWAWSPTPANTLPVSEVMLEGSHIPVQVASGVTHACALLDDGEVQCWGSYPAMPAQADMLQARVAASGMVSVYAGERASCGIAPDRTLRCWGSNSFNQVGLGNNAMTYPEPTPTSVFGSDIRDFGMAKEVSEANACAIAGDSVRCYGRGMAAGTGTTSPTPGLGTPRQIDVGLNFTCAIATTGRLLCWGGLHGQPDTAPSVWNGTPVEGLPAVASLAIGQTHACAATVDRRLFCWGDNRAGAVGNGESGENRGQTTPYEVTGLRDVLQVAAGQKFSCALTADGRAWCWGANDGGQLGLGPPGEGRPRPSDPVGSR